MPTIGGSRTAMPENDFADLLERARGGDPAAMGQLAREYEPQIRAVARRKLSPQLHAVLDTMGLVQSVHGSLLLGLRQNKFPNITRPEDLVRLAVSIVSNKAADEWNRLRRRQEILELRERLLPRARPDRAAEIAEQLQSLLETLDDRDHQLLTLYLEGRSTVDAAGILGVDPNSLRVRRSRLFKRLRASGVDID
jgi:RNA polymerase sigma-70 factor (ECF subfamily)